MRAQRAAHAVWRGLLMLGFAATSAMLFAQAITAEEKKEVLTGIEDVLSKRAFVPGVDLKTWPEHLAKQQEAIDKAENQTAFVRAVNTALRSFGISHVRFRSPQAATARTSTSVVSVGIQVQEEGENLKIVAITPESAAEKAGLKVGDLITKIDGKVPPTVAALQGEDGTELTLTIKQGDGDPKDVPLKRTRISTVRPETLSWKGEEAAILKINTFSRGYDRANIEKLLGEAAKAKFLIVDLRNNGGGAVNNLQHLLGLLLPNDTAVGTFINRSATTKFSEANPSASLDPIKIAEFWDQKFKARNREAKPFEGHIAVLINRRSASASEIFAAAMRENKQAPLVGTRTAGAVLASTYAKLPHGYELQYPVSDFVTIKGIRLEGNPLAPDAEVSANPTNDTDPVVEKAIELLKAKEKATALLTWINRIAA